MFLRFLRIGVGVWDVSSRFALLTPPLSNEAGLGSQAALLWHRTCFLSFWAGFGVVPAYFVLSTPPAHCRSVVWAIGPLKCGAGLSVLRFRFLFRHDDPPPLGAGGNLGILATPTFLQDCDFLFCLFRWYNFALPPSPRLSRYFGFSLFHRRIIAPSPLFRRYDDGLLCIFPVPCG